MSYQLMYMNMYLTISNVDYQSYKSKFHCRRNKMYVGDLTNIQFQCESIYYVMNIIMHEHQYNSLSNYIIANNETPVTSNSNGRKWLYIYSLS